MPIVQQCVFWAFSVYPSFVFSVPTSAPYNAIPLRRIRRVNYGRRNFYHVATTARAFHAVLNPCEARQQGSHFPSVHMNDFLRQTIHVMLGRSTFFASISTSGESSHRSPLR